MDLKQLKYFITVANEGNITSAAKKLYMSQPPLSIQIKKLEQEVGCTLIKRGTRSLRLTEAGKLMYDYAVKILDISRIAKEEVQYAARKGKGVIRIGIVSSLVCAMAPEWISVFVKENPCISFEITEGNTYELLEKLQCNSIHLALIRTPYSKENTIGVQLSSDTLVAVGKNEYFSSDKTTSLDELLRFPIILYRRWEKIIRDMFMHEKLEADFKFLNDDSRTSVRLAELGLGITLVPQSAVCSISSPDTGWRSIENCKIVSGIEAVTAAAGQIPEPAQMFLDFLKERIKT
ncbi:MAG: LysR family transcriptional regulator [Firmicutes bacterium]|nr:LysR family transcriptional regulator [Bacillota bacterium]